MVSVFRDVKGRATKFPTGKNRRHLGCNHIRTNVPDEDEMAKDEWFLSLISGGLNLNLPPE